MTQLTRPFGFERYVKQISLAAGICATLLILSVEFADKPVARFFFHHRGFNLGFEAMASPSLLPLPLALIYLLIFTFRKLSKQSRSAHEHLYLTISLAVIAANAAKDELKFVFGRPWPSEWLNAGIFHLHPFSGSPFFDCFPSGHTTCIAAPMLVLWWRLPQYRPIWAAIIAAVMMGLVGAGFHFVSDVIAGLFLGLAAATATLVLMPEQRLR